LHIRFESDSVQEPANWPQPGKPGYDQFRGTLPDYPSFIERQDQIEIELGRKQINGERPKGTPCHISAAVTVASVKIEQDAILFKESHLSSSWRIETMLWIIDGMKRITALRNSLVRKANSQPAADFRSCSRQTDTSLHSGNSSRFAQ
jgi:hypothetical protein